MKGTNVDGKSSVQVARVFRSIEQVQYAPHLSCGSPELQSEIDRLNCHRSFPLAAVLVGLQT
jgi:hypothetical protein